MQLMRTERLSEQVFKWFRQRDGGKRRPEIVCIRECWKYTNKEACRIVGVTEDFANLKTSDIIKENIDISNV